MNFLELHEFLLESLQLDPSVIASFYVADREWTRGLELSLIDSEVDALVPTILMSGVRLSDYVYSEEARFIYTYDMFQDRNLHLQVLTIWDDCLCDEAPLCLGGEGELPELDADPLLRNLEDIDEILRKLHSDDEEESPLADE